MSDQSSQDPADERDVNRRALLRRSGVIVAATVAGAAAVDALTPGQARAATGDNLVIGQANDSGTDATSLTSDQGASTLSLFNTGTGGSLTLTSAATGTTLSTENTNDHAPMALISQAFDTYVPVAGGELANLDGAMYATLDFGDFGGSGVFPGFVFTEFTANQVVSIVPTRVVDTRNGAPAPARANIVNPGNLDPSTGRVKAGKSIIINLDDYVDHPESLFANLTVVGPLATGFVTLSPDPVPAGTKPSTSSINYVTNQVIANFAQTAVNSSNNVAIYCDSATHILLDITAFNVGTPLQITAATPGAKKGQPAARHGVVVRKPNQ
jgi:hypothetical protein